MNKDEFFATVTPALLTFMSIAIPALLTWLTTIVRSWVAKQSEAVDRQALHMALATGTAAAEKKYANSPSTPGSERAAYAVEYAQKSVPEAIARLDPPPDVLTKLAMAKQVNLEKANAKTDPC